jgi:two-component system, chemotaxis family, CheB/CheR fusion protein
LETPTLTTEQQRFFLAAVVDSSKDSVVTIDFKGVITSWNKAAEDLYGYPGNEAIGKNLSLVVLPEDIRQLLLNIDRIKHSKAVEIYDTIRLHKGGDLINLEVVLSPVKNDRDEVIGVSTVARNITDRVKVQDTLRKSEERFRALISQTVVGIYQADLKRVITFVNDPLCNMFGSSREELIGRSLWSTTFEEDVEFEKRLFEDFKRTSTSFEIEKRIVRKSGEIRWMKESISAIYDTGGELQSTMGVLLDITEAKLAD